MLQNKATNPVSCVTGRSLCAPQVTKASAARLWWTTAPLSPVRTEPRVSAAWPDPGASVPKVGNERPVREARRARFRTLHLDKSFKL